MSVSITITIITITRAAAVAMGGSAAMFVRPVRIRRVHQLRLSQAKLAGDSLWPYEVHPLS